MIKLPNKKQRMDSFRTEWVPKLIERYSMYERPNGSFQIDANELGIIDYYPKSDKMLFRSENEWESDGLNWINENLLK